MIHFVCLFMKHMIHDFQRHANTLFITMSITCFMEIRLNNLIPDQAIKWTWETQVQENWHLSWMDHFKSIVIEDKLAILPPWKENSHAEITIKIKPGM